MKFSLGLLTLGLTFAYGYNGHFLGAEKFINKYCKEKMLFQCLGYLNIKKEVLEFLDARADCMKQSVIDDGFINKATSKNFSQVEDAPTYDESSEEDSSNEADDADVEGVMVSPNLNSTAQNPAAKPEVDLRRKMYSEDMVREVKNEAIGIINLSSCVLKKMQIIDNNDKLLFNNYVQRLKSYKLDPKLEELILEGYDYCREMAAFKPSVKLLSAISPNLKETYKFLRCEKQLTEIACIRQDFNGAKIEYDLKGLDGFMADFSDRDKSFGILWSDYLMNQMSDEEEIIF